MIQVFSCEFCKMFKTTFFIEHLRWLLNHLKDLEQKSCLEGLEYLFSQNYRLLHDYEFNRRDLPYE